MSAQDDPASGPGASAQLAALEARLRELERELRGAADEPPATGSAGVDARLEDLRSALDDVVSAAARLTAALRGPSQTS